MYTGAAVPLFWYGRWQSTDANLGREMCLSVCWIQCRSCTPRRTTRKVTCSTCLNVLILSFDRRTARALARGERGQRPDAHPGNTYPGVKTLRQ